MGTTVRQLLGAQFLSLALLFAFAMSLRKWLIEFPPPGFSVLGNCTSICVLRNVLRNWPLSSLRHDWSPWELLLPFRVGPEKAAFSRQRRMFYRRSAGGVRALNLNSRTSNCSSQWLLRMSLRWVALPSMSRLTALELSSVAQVWSLLGRPVRGLSVPSVPKAF